jgi:hypothetical protein
MAVPIRIAAMTSTPLTLRAKSVPVVGSNFMPDGRVAFGPKDAG